MSPSTGAKVLGYIRVSTEDQAREGVSLDAQESRLRDYCRAREWELVDVIRDEGRSAKDLKRPGLQAILAALPKKQRGWEALIVVKLDRLTRSVKDLAGLTEAFQRAKVGFTSIAENVDTPQPAVSCS
jgi:site-specific DNA recombinase